MSCFVHVRDLKRFRGYLTSEATLLIWKLTTIIPYLEFSLLLNFVGSNAFRTALIEL